MAKIRSNQIIEGLSGTLGRDLMFRQLLDGRTILCVKPDFSRRTFSAGQESHQNRFRAAAAYARSAAQSQPRYIQLAAGTSKTAYNIALSDWFHPPQVHAVEVQAGRIRVSASDNVLVAQVRVTLFDAYGNTLEQGEAGQANRLWWEYTPTAPQENGQRAFAEAWDLAGNVATGEITL